MKKKISIFLATVLAVGALAACGGSKPAETTAAAAAETQAAEAAEAEAAEAEAPAEAKDINEQEKTKARKRDTIFLCFILPYLQSLYNRTFSE